MGPISRSDQVKNPVSTWAKSVTDFYKRSIHIWQVHIFHMQMPSSTFVNAFRRKLSSA